MDQLFTIRDTDTEAVIQLTPVKAAELQSALAGWMLTLLLTEQNGDQG